MRQLRGFFESLTDVLDTRECTRINKGICMLEGVMGKRDGDGTVMDHALRPTNLTYAG